MNDVTQHGWKHLEEGGSQEPEATSLEVKETEDKAEVYTLTLNTFNAYIELKNRRTKRVVTSLNCKDMSVI